MVSLDGGAGLAECAAAGTAPRRVSGTHLIGGSLAAAAVAAVCVWLIEGLVLGWPLRAWLVLVSAPVLLDAFWHYEAYLVERGRPTLLDPSYFEPPLH
ncbi:MAG TPA: hypothetical protein VID75_07210 [Acidimicrobiales bacterium]|jgi:hypothetical protein